MKNSEIIFKKAWGWFPECLVWRHTVGNFLLTKNPVKLGGIQFCRLFIVTQLNFEFFKYVSAFMDSLK